MLQMILFLLPGVLSSDYNVMFPTLSICAVRGSSIRISCNFTYPTSQTQNTKPIIITKLLWCSKTQKSDCDIYGPHVYSSIHPNNQSNFQYTGDNASDCTLLIKNINSTNFGQYIFRFETNLEVGRFTSSPGVNVTVTDLKVSMTRLGVNETIKAGDSVHLTCNVSCPGEIPALQWFKNNHPIPESDPVLIFSRITPRDSGNYSCSLKNIKSSESEQIRLEVDGVEDTSTHYGILIGGVSLLSVVFIIVSVVLITRRRAKVQQTPEEKEEKKESEDVQEQEVQYASVSVTSTQPSDIVNKQNEDATIYSAVRAN